MSHVLDVRGLAPCEPFERVLETLDGLPPSADSLEVLIDREPLPLYAWLAEHGWRWTSAPAASGAGVCVHIRRA